MRGIGKAAWLYTYRMNIRVAVPDHLARSFAMVRDEQGSRGAWGGGERVGRATETRSHEGANND